MITYWENHRTLPRSTFPSTKFNRDIYNYARWLIIKVTEINLGTANAYTSGKTLPKWSVTPRPMMLLMAFSLREISQSMNMKSAWPFSFAMMLPRSPTWRIVAHGLPCVICSTTTNTTVYHDFQVKRFGYKKTGIEIVLGLRRLFNVVFKGFFDYIR